VNYLMKFNEDGTRLESFELEDLDPRGYLYVPEQVTRIGCAFKGCRSLIAVSQSLQAPYPPFNKNEVTEPQLTRVILHSSVSHIQRGAFEDCAHLESISLAKGMTIDDEAFKGCVNLEQVFFFPGVIVRVGAFSNCTRLKNVFVYTDAVDESNRSAQYLKLMISDIYLDPQRLNMKLAYLPKEDCVPYCERTEKASDRTQQLIDTLEDYVRAQKSAPSSLRAGFFSAYVAKNNQKEILKMEQLIGRIKMEEPVTLLVFSIEFKYRKRIIDILIEHQLMPDAMKEMNKKLQKEKLEDISSLLTVGLWTVFLIHLNYQNKHCALIASAGTSFFLSWCFSSMIENKYNAAALSRCPN
jgi:hypothetical protein